MTIGALLTIASMRPVIPEWKKVESPMTAKTFDDRGLVDYRVDEAGDAGVEECRVAYDGEDLFIAARALDGFTEADAAGDACAHADDRVGD